MTNIYHLHPLVAGRLGDWPHWFHHVREMGFDTVCVAPPFAVGKRGDLYVTADHERLHPALDRAGLADTAIAEMAEQARKHDLALVMDLVLDRVDASAPVVQQFPAAFHVQDRLERPDPRLTPQKADTAVTLFEDAGIADALVEWWSERLARLVQAGIAGFRCLGLTAVPMEVWQRLASALDCRMYAWTPGVARSRPPEIQAAGFDVTFASTAWWDERAAWLVEEVNALRRIGPVVSTLEPSWADRLAAHLPSGADLAAAYVHRLRVASAVGDGLFMPMGFEYGMRRAFDRAAASPEEFAAAREGAIDLTRAVQAETAQHVNGATRGPLRPLTTPDDPVTAWLDAETRSLVLINPDLSAPAPVPFDPLVLPPQAGDALTALEPEPPTVLRPGEVRIQAYAPTEPVKAANETAPRRARIAIETLMPTIPDGPDMAAKCIVGEAVVVSADIIADGHDSLAAELLWRPADEPTWRRVPMRLINNDQWQAAFKPSRIGPHVFTVEAWWDAWETFRHDLLAKTQAGQDVGLEIEEGQQLLAAAAARVQTCTRGGLTQALDRFSAADHDGRVGLLLSDNLRVLMRSADDRPFAERHPVRRLQADRLRAGYGSWYELFPRSVTTDPQRHGTFRDVIERLPMIRDMGFDVLYFPPIHPIGRINRKGPNNARNGEPHHVGSPYAIGSEEGGHDAIHPQLGSIDDFRALIAAAAEQGLELAMDFAIQCAPDHPWLKDHPDWFRWRPDGSLRYAENPPKKYEDIVNPDFFAEAALPALWYALRDVIRFWVEQGIRIFRVDNPHTKPLPFWQWLIGDIQASNPDVIFLAEAFTRPKVMHRLAKLGFTQSYTYFTWRNTKQELIEYMTELTTPPVSQFFRPNFFVNTPDINPLFLQTSGRPGFLIRAALATTLAGSWGMYSGYEICEAAPLPGREEYLDSEKYEIRPRHYDVPGNIVAEITTLNRIRRAHPALQTHLGLRFHSVPDDSVLLYSKQLPQGREMIVVAVSVDPFQGHDVPVELPFWLLDLPDTAVVDATDLVNDTAVRWHGKWQRVRLDPAQPYLIWRVGAAHG